ncbi:hypothetical protein O181_064276 [Austropuccinia psidii MF-1]|uniref:Uncharacterized protein n=1 Tax=Austropuccinia psidii MF-1 TaxID=1389203 RepID=A0A9Q3I047_9BASI|nr:hypothetical protein [Austropuccinia psidii MF-1]
MIGAEDGGYLITPMNILKSYIEKELEERILVTKRLSPPNIAEKKASKTEERWVQFKEEIFPGMQEAFQKKKEPTKNLKEQKEVVKEDPPSENEDLKLFMDQLNELTNVATPHKKIIHSTQSNNQGLRQRNNVSLPPNRSLPYVPAQNIPKLTVKCYLFMEAFQLGVVLNEWMIKTRIESSDKVSIIYIPTGNGFPMMGNFHQDI